MPIEVKYGPTPAVLGMAAYAAGQNQHEKQQQQQAAGMWHAQQQNALGYAHLGYQERNSLQQGDLERQRMAMLQQEYTDRHARTQQEIDDRAQYHQQREQDRADLLGTRKDQIDRETFNDIEKGSGTQADRVVQKINASQYTPEGKDIAGRLVGKLRALRMQKRTMRPAAYEDAMNQWLDEAENSGLAAHVVQPPSREQQHQDSVYEEMGPDPNDPTKQVVVRKWVRDKSGKETVAWDREKEKAAPVDKADLSHPENYTKVISAITKELWNQRKKEWDAIDSTQRFGHPGPDYPTDEEAEELAAKRGYHIPGKSVIPGASAPAASDTMSQAPPAPMPPNRPSAVYDDKGNLVPVQYPGQAAQPVQPTGQQPPAQGQPPAPQHAPSAAPLTPGQTANAEELSKVNATRAKMAPNDGRRGAFEQRRRELMGAGGAQPAQVDQEKAIPGYAGAQDELWREKATEATKNGQQGVAITHDEVMARLRSKLPQPKTPEELRALKPGQTFVRADGSIHTVVGGNRGVPGGGAAPAQPVVGGPVPEGNLVPVDEQGNPINPQAQGKADMDAMPGEPPAPASVPEGGFDARAIAAGQQGVARRQPARATGRADVAKPLPTMATWPEARRFAAANPDTLFIAPNGSVRRTPKRRK